MIENKALMSATVGSDEYGYGLAYRLAKEKLTAADIGQMCRKSGAEYVDSANSIVVKFLNRNYRVILPAVEFAIEGSREEVPLKDKILLLHYLTQAGGTVLSDKVIAFKELPAGNSYYRTYSKRVIKPLADNFGGKPESILDVAGELGGRGADYGDVAVTIDAFPRVPVTLVLWRGDDEFPPEGNVLYDSTVTDYLTVEDIIILSETIAWKLVKSFKARG